MIFLKKWIIFSVTCIGLFFILQTVSGMVLTALYTPDINNAWKMSTSLSESTVIYGSTSILSIVILLGISVGISYVLTRWTTRKQKPVS